MALLPPSFLVQSHCLTYGTTQSSRLVAIIHSDLGKRSTSSPKSVEEKHMWGEVVQFARRDSQHYASKALATSDTFVYQNLKKVSTYSFRTENGDQLKVHVEKKNDKYVVHVEILSEQLSSSRSELALIWGLYRSDSSCFMPLDFQNSHPNGNCSTVETYFRRNSSGRLVVELEFEPSLAPFYISFLLKSQVNSDPERLELRSHRKTNFVVPVGFSSGHAAPLGFSYLADGSMNFALFSRSAENVVLCLYNDLANGKPALEIDLDPYINRSGNVWHASLDSTMSFVRYGYRCKGGAHGNGEHVLLDPYSKFIADSIPAQHGSDVLLKSLGILQKEPSFDWNPEVRPCIPMEKLIIYRLNVTQFTKDKSSNLPNQIAGTFSGVAEKLHHLKGLGVNAIMLEPIFPSDEQKGPYFPWHFFSPSSVYGPPDDPISLNNSLKEMVKMLHVNGMEVFLEVVFTHTAEVGTLRQIDDSSYYHVHSGDSLENRNTLNCNYPIVQQMILDSLRHWVIEFHIDGFCFKNSSSLLRGFHGEFLSRPPLVEAIAFDPLISKVKVISDSWDPCELKAKETLFPHWRRWAELNTKFCHDVRNFLRGNGLLSDLATRLCGSGDIFLDGRGPAFSFNHVASNFELPLVDLVSFGRSGLASQLSWNCGEEGPTNKAAVLETRLKQIRNFLFILFISLGVPVLNMGDECGQSSGGSPSYNERTPFNWNALQTTFGIQTTQFISFLSSLRTRRSDILQRRNFWKEENIGWRGSNLSPPRWDDPSCRFLALTLKAETETSESSTDSNSMAGDLFVALNAADHSENIVLPQPPAGMTWFLLADTALPFPGFFAAEGVPIEDKVVKYEMKPHSCVLFEAKSPSG